jgi:signal transduction histidine kinase
VGRAVTLAEFFDDGARGASLAMSARGRLSRVIVAALVGVVLAITFNLAAAGAWMAANLALEAWLWIWLGRFDPNRAKRTPVLARLAPVVAYSAIWSTMAAACWIHGAAPMKFVALIIMFGVVIEGLKYAAVMPSAFAVLIPFPFAAMIVAPVLSGGFRGWDHAYAALALAGLAAYVIDAARLVRGNARALEQAQAEALEASRAKSAFLAMMSHELRTPMNGVLGMAHALAATKLGEKQAAYLDMIIRSGDGLMAILNDILDLSKIEAGKLELETVSFSLPDLAQQAYVLWSETARTKGVELTLEIDPATPPWLAGDPTRLRQVMMNLVSNALKFTAEGRVDLRIAPRADGVEIMVSDTGVGMTEAQLGRLFEAFSQAESSTARRFGGTGLGLSICRRLVEMMGGTIAVTSRQGQGSTFTVFAPLRPAPAPDAIERPSQVVGLDGRELLVVDDNAVNQAVARAILEAAGARVTVAGDGREGLERLRGGPFDIVLMDVHMPEMDGVEALRRIRAGEAGRPDIPVLALTADAMSGEGERLCALGFDGAQPKPIHPVELILAVAELCAGDASRGRPKVGSGPGNHQGAA